MKKKKQIILPPEDGWKSQTYYVVEIVMFMNNPIHQDIFYTGFLDDKGYPQGYNKLFQAECEISDVKFMRAVREIDKTIDNEYKMVSETVPEYFI